MTAVIFRQLFDARSSTYTYLVADAASGAALLIDPVLEQIERDLKLLHELGLRLVYAVDTHVHADHVTASGALRTRTGARTATGARAGVECADLALSEGDLLAVGDHDLHVLETPGHTAACLSLAMRDRVFTGDCLLIRGCGRTDFQDGDARALYDSITGRLFALPDATLVYPAHDYRGMTVSTIGEERRCNPRLRAGRDAFMELMAHLDLADPQRMHEAVPANRACGEPAAT